MQFLVELMPIDVRCRLPDGDFVQVGRLVQKDLPVLGLFQINHRRERVLGVFQRDHSMERVLMIQINHRRERVLECCRTNHSMERVLFVLSNIPMKRHVMRGFHFTSESLHNTHQDWIQTILQMGQVLNVNNIRAIKQG